MTVAAVAKIFCNHFRRESSRRTRTTGDVETRSMTGSRRRVSLSLTGWYLQHGSNCQDAAYTDAHRTLLMPRPRHAVIDTLVDVLSTPAAIQPAADRTAVLWRQFPTRIHLDVSSPSCCGSMRIIGEHESRACSSSDKAISGLLSSDITKQSPMSYIRSLNMAHSYHFKMSNIYVTPSCRLKLLLCNFTVPWGSKAERNNLHTDDLLIALLYTTGKFSCGEILGASFFTTYKIWYPVRVKEYGDRPFLIRQVWWACYGNGETILSASPVPQACLMANDN